MQRNEQVWVVSATVLSLAAFSYFAGLGLRGVLTSAAQAQRNTEGLGGYPKVASASGGVPAPDLRPMETFRAVLQKLQLYYVEALPPNPVLAHGSVEAMLAQLNDPNTRLLSRAEVEAVQGAARGDYAGIGAVLTIRRFSARKPGLDPESGREVRPGDRTITVVATAPGGPADRAGLKPGDRITEIDGHWIAPVHVSYRLLTQITDPLGLEDGKPLAKDELPEERPSDPERQKARQDSEEQSRKWTNATDLPLAMQALVALDRGTRELTIERGTPSKSLKIKVTMGRHTAPVMSSRMLDGDTGYLQISAFNDDTPAEVRSALADMQKRGAKYLTLDLRQSAGGSLEAAREVAGALLGDAKFAVLRERTGGKVADRALWIKGASRSFKPSAVNVLVDGGTAGSSELLAAALRENIAAKLIGTTTFGDGTEQELVRLDDGSAVSITRARMMSARGIEFEGKGLKADVVPQGDALETAAKLFSQRAAAAPAPGP